MLLLLSISALVAEIKEIKDKRQQEDNVLLSIAAGCKHPIIPNLVFDYTDMGIHEDYYKLIKYSCEEICTSKEQSNKAMRLWCTLLEPMLSVPSRPSGSENTERTLVSKHHGISAGTSVRGREENLVADAAPVNFMQLKPLSNREKNTSPKQVDSRRISVLNGDILVKEDDFGLPKDIIHTCVVDKGSSDRLASFDAALTIEDDKTPPEVGMEIILGVFRPNIV